MILLAAFGTLVAALAPLAVGFVAVAVTGALVYWLAPAGASGCLVRDVRGM